MSDFAFKLTSLAGFYTDLNTATDQFGYSRMTDAITGRLPNDPGTGADFLAMAEQDASRLDFIHVANLTSMPNVPSGPHLDIRVSFVRGNNPTPADQAKMTTLLINLATFFALQTPAIYTPDPAVQAAFGVAARSYPKTANGTWVVVPLPSYPKFGW
jgi:hypothetical protein